MATRKIEVFSAGCPCCKEAIALVRSMTCESCEVQILDMHDSDVAQAKAKQYRVRRVPAVVVDGRLADRCQGEVSVASLRELGVGAPS